MQMDFISSYQEFETDIKNAFKNVIDKYQFTLSKRSEGVFELINGKCSIVLSFDRGDIFCFLSDPKGNKSDSFQLWSVYRYLYKNEIPDTKWYNPSIQLKNLALIADEKLSHILQGDFLWIDGYKNEKDELKKLIRFVSNEMDRNSDIYLKYRNDDPTWLDDIKGYIQNNNIKFM
jgi:hypothetical protein